MLHRMIERQMNRWPCIIEYIGYEPINMCRSTADTLSQETMGWDALVTGHWSLVTGHSGSHQGRHKSIKA